MRDRLGKIIGRLAIDLVLQAASAQHGHGVLVPAIVLMEVIVRLLEELGQLLGIARLEIGVHEPHAILQIVGPPLDQRFEKGNRFGEAVLGSQVSDELRLPVLGEHLAAMGVHEDLNRPAIVVQAAVQVLRDILTGRAGLLFLGPGFLGGAGEIGLLFTPVVLVALQ